MPNSLFLPAWPLIHHLAPASRVSTAGKTKDFASHHDCWDFFLSSVRVLSLLALCGGVWCNRWGQEHEHGRT